MKPAAKGEGITERDLDALNTNALKELDERFFMGFNYHPLRVQREVVDGQPFCGAPHNVAVRYGGPRR